jgi:hypothetical protein
MTWLSVGLASMSVGLLLGCSRAAAPAPATPRAPVATSEYVTIRPDVSVSRNAEPAELEQASLDPHADVMAEILALPAGR